ncbi:putative ribonuclease H-like domain-containing protein [Tanacetum coccineum]
MNPIAAQQVDLDNALVTPENRVQIGQCNMRIDLIKTQKQPTYQVFLDSLVLSPLYPAFRITVEVPEIYMHQFWHTIIKIKNSSSYKFKLDKKQCKIDVEVDPVARTITNADGSSTSTIPGPVTTEEKAQKKNDVKARSMLLMALPNEHQLTFSQYKDTKTFASSQESLDSISNRIQKIVSQLSILGENISQEDLNFKFLRSLPSEWSMHVVVWRNKPDLGTISFDDLYNNFKIVEQEVKRSVTSSSNSSSQNVAFVSTPGSSNEDNTANVQYNTLCFQVIDVVNKSTMRKFAPTAVLTKSGIVPISTARQRSSKAAAPLSAARPINTAAPKLFVNAVKTKPNVFQKAYLLFRRPFNQQTTLNNRSLNNKVNTAKINSVNTAKGKRVTSVVGIFDSGCSRHMTRNKSFFIDYQDYDGGFVAFAGSTKGGRITGKGIENQLNHKVKIIRCDNGTEFKNYEMNQLCGIKGIKREFSNARTLQQKEVAERKNRTLIEAAITMLGNKTPYELLISRTPIISFMRPFGCPVTILNTLDHLGKFDGKADEGFLVGLETNFDAGQAGKENVTDQEYILLPLLHTSSNVPSNSEKDESPPKDDAGKMNEVRDSAKDGNMNGPGEAINTDRTNKLNTVSSPFNTVSSPLNTVGSTVNTVSSSFTTVDPGRAKEQRNKYESLFDPLIPDLEDTADLQDTGIFGSAYDNEYMGAEADLNNLETTMSVSPIPTTRIHKDYPKAQIIGEVDSAVQTRRMHKQNEAGLITFINKQKRTNHKDFQNCLFDCFLSQMKPKKVTQALDDESWVEAMQEELLQFKLLNVWTMVDLPHGKKTRRRYDYDEVFAPVARIEAIRLFLAFASFMGFIMYQMDVKSAFLYCTIKEEVYVNQPPGFVDPEFPTRVYKVGKALYGIHQAPRAWYETLSTYLMENGFRRGTINKTLFIKKIKNDILLVQVYVDDIIFGSTKESLSTEFEQLTHKRFQMSSMGELTFFLGLQTISTPMEIHKPLLQDTASTDVDVYLYRFQVQPKASHMHAIKRIFRYLKGQPSLGLWYPKDSPMDLIAYSDSDYAGASIDRKSTTGGC